MFQNYSQRKGSYYSWLAYYSNSSDMTKSTYIIIVRQFDGYTIFTKMARILALVSESSTEIQYQLYTSVLCNTWHDDMIHFIIEDHVDIINIYSSTSAFSSGYKHHQTIPPLNQKRRTQCRQKVPFDYYLSQKTRRNHVRYDTWNVIHSFATSAR